MKSSIDFNGFDTLLQPTEWRFSAAITGIVKYFDFHKIEYTTLSKCDEKPNECIQGFDGILYNQSDITEERYLDFAESYFKNDMTHLQILSKLESDEFEESDIKLVNDYIKSKTILKKIFSKIKFDGKNKEIIKELISENRHEIIKSIFRYGKNLYSNFCNANLLLSDATSHCRLQGYSVDEGRKTRFLGFCFSEKSADFNDIPEFDFVPFAFSNSDMFETYFINNNFTVDTLVRTNNRLSDELSKVDKSDSREKFLTVLKESKKFINYDVEVIVKKREKDIFETLFVRAERLEYLQQLPEQSLRFVKELAPNYWFNLEREVYERCLNNVLLDDVIVQMLKFYFEDNVNKTSAKIMTDRVIEINQSWKGNDIVNEIQTAKKLGFVVSQELVRISGKNKVFSYKQKIISALVAHDYDRVKEVMLSLSSYVKMEFPFFYAFLEDAEANKDIAFAFASALHIADK